MHEKLLSNYSIKVTVLSDKPCLYLLSYYIFLILMYRIFAVQGHISNLFKLQILNSSIQILSFAELWAMQAQKEF